MSSSYPTALDSFTNPTACGPMVSPSHSRQHADANDAIEALEAKVGADGSAVTTSLDYLVKSATDPGHLHSASAVASGVLPLARGGTNAATAAAARTSLGLAVGADVQAYDANLTTWAAKTAPSGTVAGTTDSQTLTNKTLTTPVISSISNTGTLTLPTSSDTLVGRATTDTLTNKTISGSSNTLTNVSLTSSVTGTLPVANGGTGATTAASARTSLGAQASVFLTVGSANADYVTDGTDDDVQIQAALDAANAAGGVVVVLKPGTFNISNRLRIYSYTTLRGSSAYASDVHSTNYGSGQTITGGGLLYGADLQHVTVEDIHFRGTGKTGTNCYGIIFDLVSAGNNKHVTIRNVRLDDIAGTGVAINTPIMTVLDDARVVSASGHGFNVYTGTSTVLRACYAGGCDQAGYRLYVMTYSALECCASESNGLSFLLENSNNNLLLACGAEVSNDKSAGYPGTHYRITGGTNNTLSCCYSIDFDTGAASGNKGHLDFIDTTNAVVENFRGAASSVAPTFTYKVTNSTVALHYYVFAGLTGGGGSGTLNSDLLLGASPQYVLKGTGNSFFRADRPGTSAVATFALANAGVDRWSVQLRGDSTNNLYIRDNGNGRNIIALDAVSGQVQLLGSLALPFAAKTAAYTLTGLDSIVTADAAGGAFTVTLPTAVSIPGRLYTVKRINSGGNAVTVGTTSSQTIDGASTYSLSSQYSVVTVVSDGANWLVV